MLTRRFKSSLDRILSPLARCLATWGISPTILTGAGFALVMCSCVVLIVTRRIVLFCVLALVASLFDALDGAVARLSGRVTKSGAYLDAMCDRLSEALVVVCVAWVTGYWFLSSLVAIGALLVSYAKARAAMEVAVSNLEWPDLMERTERGVLYLAGLAASAVVSWKPFGRDVFWWTLVIVAALSYATVIQRMRRALGLIRMRS